MLASLGPTGRRTYSTCKTPALTGFEKVGGALDVWYLCTAYIDVRHFVVPPTCLPGSTPLAWCVSMSANIPRNELTSLSEPDEFTPEILPFFYLFARLLKANGMNELRNLEVLRVSEMFGWLWRGRGDGRPHGLVFCGRRGAGGGVPPRRRSRTTPHRLGPRSLLPGLLLFRSVPCSRGRRLHTRAAQIND